MRLHETHLRICSLRWERFQIAVDGDTARVLDPASGMEKLKCRALGHVRQRVLRQGDKCCPVAGPEVGVSALHG